MRQDIATILQKKDQRKLVLRINIPRDDFQNNHVAIDIWCESLYHYMHKHKNLSSTFPPGHRAVFVVSY